MNWLLARLGMRFQAVAVLAAISLPACGFPGTVRRLWSVQAAVAHAAGTASRAVSVNVTNGRYLTISVDNRARAGNADDKREQARSLARAAYAAYDLRSTLERVTVTFKGDAFPFRSSDLIETAGRDQPMPRPPERISLHLLPIDDVPPDLIAPIASRLRMRFPIALTVLPALALDPAAYDDRRDQAIAESLIESIQKRYADVLREPEARIIAVTPDDMYVRSERWAFAFSLRDSSDRIALVSYARMGPEMFGNAPDQMLLQSRLRKMVTKNIGILCYGFPQSKNPRSVLYGSIGGTDELDLMTEEFNPAD